MSGSSRHTPALPAFSRRFVTLFMVLLAVPVLMLLWLNVHSVRRLWSVSRSASLATDAGQLAAALEQRTSELAGQALRDTELVNGARSVPDSISQRQDFRSVIARVRQRHPVVKSIFIVRNGAVEFPRLTAPEPSSRARYVGEYGGTRTQILNSLFARAEGQQRQGAFTEALGTLAQAGDASASTPLKALVLDRTAACFRRMGLADKAEAAYATLSARYADEYTPEGVPYAIAASLARQKIDPAELAGVYQQMSSGRWELSVEQVGQLQARFRSRLGDAALRQSSEYLDEADIARSLQQALRQRGRAGQTGNTPQQIADNPGLFAFAFAGLSNYQSYYTTVTRENGEKALLGLTVDLDWLQQTVCPELGIGDAFELGYTRDAVAPAISTPFKRAFPFWNLRPATTAARQSAAHLETMVAMSSEVLAAILCFGLFALHRHVAREREMTRVRSDFISGVSHELRTPITVIRLYSETLMESPDLQAEGREYCEVISCEAQRLDRLVEGVLNVSAIERGLAAYKMQQCDIGCLTTQTLAHVRRYYHYKGYAVSEDIARDLPPVKADAEAFKSALLNLVDNAIKYSNSSGVVRVHAYRSGGAVVVAVEDSGIGIAPEALKKIFDPFYRADNAGAHGGCGLGLFLVRHIMTAHGGDVRVTSEVGSGSRFELVFPVALKQENRTTAARAAAVVAPRIAKDRLA